MSRGTVDRALAVDWAPTYQREPTGSSFDAFASQVRVLIAATQTMPASAAAERVGWSGSPSLFRSKVAQIRPEHLVPDPADRLVHPPGFQVQCDLWFPHEAVALGHDQYDTPPVLVMTSTFSGFIQARVLPSRSTPDLLGGRGSLLQEAAAVPARLRRDKDSGAMGCHVCGVVAHGHGRIELQLVDAPAMGRPVRACEWVIQLIRREHASRPPFSVDVNMG